MYRYALSVRYDDVLLPEWKLAAAKANLKRIELSCAIDLDCGTIGEVTDVLLELQETSGLEVASLHLPFRTGDDWPFTSLDEGQRKQTAAKAIDFAKQFRQLKFKHMTIHCGGEPNIPEQRKQKIAQMQNTISDFMPLLEQWNCSLNVELLPRTCIGNCEQELFDIIAPFDDKFVGICLDVNHVMGRIAELPQIIRTCASRIHTFHISDYDGIDEQHWFVGQGCIKWSSVMEAIREIDHETTLIFETFMLRNMRPNPEFWFHNVENQAFYLENADQLEQMRGKFTCH